MKHFRILTASALVALVFASFAPAAAASSTEATWTGTLTAISSTTIPATLTLQVGTTSYTVNVTADTDVVRKFNGDSSLFEFGIGDTLKVEGTLSGTTITASEIKDWSIQRKGGSFWGTILTLDADQQTFTIKPEKRSTQTVAVKSTTKVFQGNRRGTFEDLAVGMRVKVIGLWRKSTSTIDADRILIKLTELDGKVVSTSCETGIITVSSKRGNSSSEEETNRTVKAGKKGSERVNWTVTLTADTVLRDKRMNPIVCADLKANHEVKIRGLSTGALSLNAIQVMDKSARKEVEKGRATIQAIDATAQTLTVTRGDDTQTVVVGPETIIVDENGKKIAFSALAVGHSIHVLGTLDGETISANLIIDKSLPEDSD